MSARICRSINDGGLMGQHYSYEFIYAPDHYFGDAAEAYLAGVLLSKRF